MQRDYRHHKEVGLGRSHLISSIKISAINSCYGKDMNVFRNFESKGHTIKFLCKGHTDFTLRF